jgi:hypothetical protein
MTDVPLVRGVIADWRWGRGSAHFQRMTSIERNILDTLIELETTAAAARTVVPKPSVLPLLERLDRLAAELPADAPGDLRHYMQRKSYEKARLFLIGRGSENAHGNCGH